MDGNLDAGATLLGMNNGISLWAALDDDTLYLACTPAGNGLDRFLVLASAPVFSKILLITNCVTTLSTSSTTVFLIQKTPPKRKLSRNPKSIQSNLLESLADWPPPR